jgi:hypothetical protein
MPSWARHSCLVTTRSHTLVINCRLGALQLNHQYITTLSTVFLHQIIIMSTRLYFATLLLLCPIFVLWKRSRRCQAPLPPGPRKLPLLGNLLNLPKGNEWMTYHQWCQDLSRPPNQCLFLISLIEMNDHRFGNYPHRCCWNVNHCAGY